MARTTSKDAYKDLPQTHINRQEKAILKYVMSRIDATRREIAHALKMETSTVSARVNSLVKYGVLDELGRRKCRISGKNVWTLSA